MKKHIVPTILMVLIALLGFVAVRKASARLSQVNVPVVKPPSEFTIIKTGSIDSADGKFHELKYAIEAIRADGARVRVLRTPVAQTRHIQFRPSAGSTETVGDFVFLDESKGMKSTYPKSEMIHVEDWSTATCPPPVRYARGWTFDKEETLLGYQAIKVSWSNSDTKRSIWYAPALGCLLVQSYFQDSEGTSTANLAQVIVGPPDPTLFDVGKATEAPPSLIGGKPDNAADAKYNGAWVKATGQPPPAQ